jgi:hypothetical protein
MGVKTSIGLIAASLGTMVVLESSSPVLAHKTQVAGEVGGTIHIEPNDNPQAGTPSLTWFALTRQGGELIPLDACNCKLSLYAQPRQSADSPIAQPPLKAISAEGYENVPAADITFPNVGAYDLVLQGEAKTPDDFQPFELIFDVSVAVGQSATPPSPAPPSPTVAAAPSASIAPAPTSLPLPASEQPTWLFWGIPLGILAIGLPLLLRIRKRPKD